MLRSVCCVWVCFFRGTGKKALAFSPWVHAWIWLSLQMWFITHIKKEEEKIIFRRRNETKQWSKKVKEQKRNKEIGQIENESGHEKKKNKINLFTEKKGTIAYIFIWCPEAFFADLVQLISYSVTSFKSALTPCRRIWNRNLKSHFSNVRFIHGICIEFDAKTNWIHAMHMGYAHRGWTKRNLSTLWFRFRSYFPIRKQHKTKFYSEFLLFQVQMQLINWKWIIGECPVNGHWKFHLYSFGSAKQ